MHEIMIGTIFQRIYGRISATVSASRSAAVSGSVIVLLVFGYAGCTDQAVEQKKAQRPSATAEALSAAKSVAPSTSSNDTMPHVIGRNYIEAISILGNRHIEVKLVGGYAKGVATYDKVIGQSPKAGSPIKTAADRTIMLTLSSQTSSKPQEAVLPYAVGEELTTSSTTLPELASWQTTTTTTEAPPDLTYTIQPETVADQMLTYLEQDQYEAAYGLTYYSQYASDSTVQGDFSYSTFYTRYSTCFDVLEHQIKETEVGPYGDYGLTLIALVTYTAVVRNGGSSEPATSKMDLAAWLILEDKKWPVIEIAAPLSEISDNPWVGCQV